MKSLFIEPLLPLEVAMASATSDEVAAVGMLKPETRRREFLTWRALVRRELGPDVRITYNAVGAPVVDRDIYIGVSHCRDRVAVCISDAPCAVDIEPVDRDVSRVAEHYMTPEERALCDDPHWPAVVWCAKETLYKYAGREGLDLRRDLHLLKADLADGRVTGCIENGEPVGLSVSFRDGFLIVWIL